MRPRASVASRSADGALQDRLLDLADRAGDADLAGAGLGAVEDGAAAPDALAPVQLVQPGGAGLVARVEDEAVRVHDRRRAHELVVRPERGAGGGAGRAEDALGGVVEALTLFDRLQPLALGRGRVVDEEGEHGAVLGE